MTRWTYGTSAVLALSGTGSAVAGIVLSEWKPTASGLVLLCGATVFALLFIGMRRRPAPPGAADGPEPGS
jgi:hypothetical protein